MSPAVPDAASAGEGEGSAEFKCLACGLGYERLELLKEHYRTELHRCNLGRKVAGQAPLRAEEFERRAAEQQEVVERPLPSGKDKHSRKKAKEMKQRAKNEERARRREAKMLKIQQRMEASVSEQRRPSSRPPVSERRLIRSAAHAATGGGGAARARAHEPGGGGGAGVPRTRGGGAEAGPRAVHLLRHAAQGLRRRAEPHGAPGARRRRPLRAALG